MQFIKNYWFCCIFLKEILQVRLTISPEKPIKINFFDGVVNYLNNESKLHQVVFIFEDEMSNTDLILNSLLKAVDTSFPSFSMKYKQVKNLFER